VYTSILQRCVEVHVHGQTNVHCSFQRTISIEISWKFIKNDSHIGSHITQLSYLTNILMLLLLIFT
jgi:hypothetical protein